LDLHLAEYFDAFHVPVFRGRAFTEGDSALAPKVVIINETMARLLSPKGDPLNERLFIGRGMRPEYEKDTARQIVGIVGDIRDQSLNRRPRPAMYVPLAQLPDEINTVNLRLLPIAWFIRTRVEPQALGTLIQNELRQASGGLPVASIRSMDDIERRSVARQNFSMLLMTIFGCAALLLAAIGIYGLLAYSVQQRTQEIGIRMALGARPEAVRNMILFQGMRLALVGVAIGIAAALGLTRLLASFLFGVQPRDPLVFIAVPVLLTAVALLACYLPARRATRINPLEALRWE
jgi:predicted permease